MASALHDVVTVWFFPIIMKVNPRTCLLLSLFNHLEMTILTESSFNKEVSQQIFTRHHFGLTGHHKAGGGELAGVSGWDLERGLGEALHKEQRPKGPWGRDEL